MAGFRQIAGSGYGNSYIDALIAGGAVWDTSVAPLTMSFGNWHNANGWEANHGGPKVSSSGTPYLQRTSPTSNEWLPNSWHQEAFPPILNAVNELLKITNIKLSPTWEAFGENVRNDNLILWLTNLPIEGTSQVWVSADSPQEVYDRNLPSNVDQSWLYIHAGEGAWRYPHKGGMGYMMLLNMFGSALGLQQAYQAFPGVTGATDPGPLRLNQAPFTVMSGNWSYEGDGEVTGKYGSMKSFGAFDIAALQKIYGANMTAESGNNVYNLPQHDTWPNDKGSEAGTGWTCIWDTGGVDTISTAGSVVGATIDLRAATLADNDPNAGGYISRHPSVAGGFTIANGVVIENAIGGSGDDILIGNSATNRLDGGRGNDTYYIDSPNDVIVDSGGNDTVYATFNFSAPEIENVFVNGVKVISGGVVTGNGFNPIKGNAGRNTLVGNEKNDKLYGGLGNDTLTGKGGIDIFVFNTKPNKSTNRDKITDFSMRDDSIWLDNKIFKKLGSRGSESNPATLKASFFKISDKAKDRDDYLVYNKKTGVLSYDADGSGSQAAVEFAVLKKNLALTYNDFAVI